MPVTNWAAKFKNRKNKPTDEAAGWRGAQGESDKTKPLSPYEY
jgi:hypothetical protein